MSDHVVALRFVRLFKGKKRLEAIFDAGKHRRVVKYSWQAKGDSDVPPPDWYEIVKRELSWRDGDRKRGMPGGY